MNGDEGAEAVTHFQVNPPCKLPTQCFLSPKTERCPERCLEHVFFKAPLEKRLWWIFKKKVCSGIFFFHKSTLMEQSRKAVSNLGILLLFSSKLMTFKISIHWRR